MRELGQLGTVFFAGHILDMLALLHIEQGQSLIIIRRDHRLARIVKIDRRDRDSLRATMTANAGSKELVTSARPSLLLEKIQLTLVARYVEMTSASFAVRRGPLTLLPPPALAVCAAWLCGESVERGVERSISNDQFLNRSTNKVSICLLQGWEEDQEKEAQKLELQVKGCELLLTCK